MKRLISLFASITFLILVAFIPGVYAQSLNILCQYASSAVADSEQLTYLATYAIGSPDADGECSSSVGGVSWAPTHWSIPATLNLTFATPVYATNFTVFGDQGMSWESMWIYNDETNVWVQVSNFSGACVHEQVFDTPLGFLSSQIMLKKTTLGWSATDAVQLCGIYAVCGNGILEDGEECDDGNDADGDGCSSQCVTEFCGDGIVQSGISEECDDGNDISGDGCTRCKLECPSSQAGHAKSGVYRAARVIDIGLDIDGSGSSINPTDFRSGNYAFTGERIIYYVLVRDEDGREFINLIKWVKDGVDEEGPCDEVFADTGEFIVEENGRIVEIDTATNQDFDCQTDKVYKCVLTVESGWTGSLIHVEAENVLGPLGQTPDENWNFNLALEVDVSTSNGEPLAFGNPILDQDAVFVSNLNCVNKPWNFLIDGPAYEDQTYRNCLGYIACDNGEVFGHFNDEANVDLDDGDSFSACVPRDAEKKCDVSFSTNKLVVTNIGEVNLWAFIASENFYASEGLAKCPYTNELHANQFEYRATAGSYDSGWRLMPQYSPNLGCAGIGIGDSEVEAPAGSLGNFLDIVFGQCRGGCRIPAGGPGFTSGGAQTNPPLPGLDILSPTHTIEVALKIVWPTPCIGSFDEGAFHVLVRAV